MIEAGGHRATEGLVMSQTLGFTGCMRAEPELSLGRGESLAMRAIRKGILGAVGVDIVMETWRRERMSHLSKGMGHWGITRKEWEKGMGLSRIVHKREGGV